MAMQFRKARKLDSKLRMCLIGPSGAGKTFSALRMAMALGERVAVIDTEHGSAAKYADRFDFDHLELESFSPEIYIEAIQAAEEAGYDVLIIDSLSHAWSGTDGALEMVDKAAIRGKGNKFAPWKDVTPLWNKLLNTIVGSSLHVIGTMRSKTEYLIEEDEKGRKVPRKVGLAPIFRSEGEYEFDVIGELDHDHRLIITKTRCDAIDGAIIMKPGPEVAGTLKAWLTGEADPRVGEINRLGRLVYGDEWGDEKHARTAEYISGDRVSECGLLKPTELERAIALLTKKLEQKERKSQQQQSAPAPQRPADEPSDPPAGKSSPPAQSDEPRSEIVGAGEASAVIQYLRDIAKDYEREEGETGPANKKQIGEATYPLRKWDPSGANGRGVSLFLMAVFSLASPNELTAAQAIVIRQWATRSVKGKLQLLSKSREEFLSVVHWWESQMVDREIGQAA